jgi:hypothetical protein
MSKNLPDLHVRRLHLNRRMGSFEDVQTQGELCSLCGYPVREHDANVSELYGRARACVSLLLDKIADMEDRQVEIQKNDTQVAIEDKFLTLALQPMIDALDRLSKRLEKAIPKICE